MAEDSLRALAADVAASGGAIRTLAAKALEVTGRSIRDDWRDNAAEHSGSGFSVKYPSSIYYDVESGLTDVSVEIGPELGRPGGSAGFLEDAPGDVRAAPQHSGRDALEANEDDFYEGLAIAAVDAVMRG